MLAEKLLPVAKGGATDPYFYDVTLLLPGNGTNGAQNNTFLDSSSNAFTITRNGNTTQGTFTPYGSNWSNYFNSSSDSIGPGSNAAFSFGTNDFSIELWFYPLTNSATNTMFANGAAASGSMGLYLTSTGKIELACYGGSNLDGATTVTANTWHHIVATRSGTTMRVFLDGVLDGSSTNAFNNTSNTISIGGIWSTLSSGYISNLRVCKGAIPTSYQTSSTTVGTVIFTPPTAPLTTTSQGASSVSLLTCQSNRFADSTNTYTFTTSGTPSVQRFSPFNPTSAYSTSVIGGSGFWDGTNDYLSVGTAANWAFMSNTTAKFTVEFWVYNNTTGSYTTLLDTGNSTTAGVGLTIQKSNSEYVTLQIYYGSAGNYIVNGASSATLTPNAWNHVFISYDQSLANTNAVFYINGVAAGTANKTANTPSSSNPTNTLAIGCYGAGGGNFFTGYISSLRISNNVRSAPSGVPTSPYTSDANTALLLSMTNGAIFDNAAMNDLETVGNAQISTSVKKYGTGSMAFDGTGDYLLTRLTPNMQFGTGDWTIELWFYINSASGTQVLLSGTSGGLTAGAWEIYAVDGGGVGGMNFANSSWADYKVQMGSVPSINTWYHLAITRSGTSTRLFLNGVLQNTTTVPSGMNVNGTGSTVLAGAQGNIIGSLPLNGYIDDLRITKGYARYTSNFTAPTAAFPLY